MPRLETATPAPDNTFLDIKDESAVYTSGEPASMLLRTAGTPQGMPASISGTILQTTIGTINVTNFLGRQWIGALTQAVAGLRGGSYAADVTRVGFWPLGLDWSGFPASATQVRLRYLFSLLMQRTVPVVGDGRFGVGVCYSLLGPTTLVSEDVNTSVGAEISSKPSVNGGNWTCLWRTASAGVLGSFDTGIAPDGSVQKLGFYYDCDINQLTFQINDLPVHILTAVDVPQPTTVGNVVQRLGVAQYSSGVANQQDRWGEARAQIQRL